MKTYDDLRKEIARIEEIDVEGFDNNWVFQKFTANQALINIKLIKPYTKKYNLIIEFLVTGNPELADAASDAAVNIVNTVNAAKAVNAADAAADASRVTNIANVNPDYSYAILDLQKISNDYLALLKTKKVKEMTISEIEKEFGIKVV